MPNNGPLAGIRIIDITSYVFGPVATQMLGDMGADVIKIEPPQGDYTRYVGRGGERLMGSFFLNLNRNKRSVVLDLKQEEDRGTLRRLLGTADVFLHNMRDSAVEKLGLTYGHLKSSHPRLVYAAAQGFGSGGRYEGRPAYDDVIQGFSGISGMNERMTGAAGFVPMLMTDKICGLYLAYAVTAALMHRASTGKGQLVQVPMFESTVAFNLYEHMADAVFAPADGHEAVPLGYGRVFGSLHRPLKTQDGFICVVANTDQQWQRMFEVFGQPEVMQDPRFAQANNRTENIAALYEAVESALSRRPTSEWLALLEAADIPAGPSNGLQDLRHDPHLKDTGFFVAYEHDTEGRLTMPRPPIVMSESPAEIRLGPPRLGQHTQEVLAEIPNP